jgi:hypothetical protein
MTATANGIAHLSYPGGGFFVPVRTPYDRQMLLEQVVERVRTKGQVQILIDDRRWLVRHLVRAPRVSCGRCGGSTDSACTSPLSGKVIYCPECALAGTLDRPPANATTVKDRALGGVGRTIALSPSLA